MPGTAGLGRSALALQIIEGAEDAVFALDEQSRFILANPAAERLFGAAEAELLGRFPWAALPAAVGTPLESACRRAMAERVAVEVEPFSGLAQKSYEVRIRPLASGGLHVRFRDATDRRRAPAKLGQDVEQNITERRQTGEELRQAKEASQRQRAQLETILDSLTEGLVVADLEGNLYHWNPAAVTMHGFSSLEECQRRLPEFAKVFELSDADGNVLPLDQWPLARILRGEHLRNLEIRIRRLHGDWKRVFSYGGRLARDPHGQKLLAVVTVSDITERRRTEEALRDSHQRLEAGVRERTAELNRVVEALAAERRRFQDVLDILPAYVVLLTPDYHVPFANRFFEERFGKAHGRRCFEYLFGREEPCEICETYSALKTMAPHRWEWTGPDGRNYDIFDFPFIDADGSTLILEMGLDITERKRMEDQLRATNESLRRLAAIVECSEDAIVGKNLDGVITSWNDGAEKIYGYAASEVIGKHIEILTPSDRPDEVARILEHIRCGEVVEHYETVRLGKDGRSLAVSLTVSPIKDAAGRLVGASTIARDITERKRMEEEVRGASIYARGLIEASLDPLVTVSPEGKVTDVNEATVLVTGVPRERLVGSDFSDYFTEPDRARAGYRKVLSDGLVHDYPLTIRHVEGRTTDVLYNAVVYRDQAGQVQGVFAAARDVTERKRMEEEVRGASIYARGLIEASLDPLVTVSPEGKVTDVNEATVLVTGVPRERLVGSDFSDYFTEPDRARAGYRKVLSDGLVRDYPLTIRHVEGRTTDVLYNAVVYRNQAGQVQGVFAAARDVTERKRVEAELARYRDHLEELVRQRTRELETANAHLQRTTGELAHSNQELEQYAYVASHDLQEPLRAVTGYLGLIEQHIGDQLDDQGRRYLAGAAQGAARMHTLITDLLALSRVGTQGQPFESADLNGVLDEALRGLDASVKETGAKITRDPLPTLPMDARQMTQLFQNLISNALKFRGEQPPEIHISAQAQPGQWVLGVRDNGIGIEPQYVERIFLIFQRLHTRKQYPGTGIGLAICKKIVERHGGTIWVESQPGQGSTFYFTIPERAIL